jgi:hypothetical protein
VNQLAVLTDLNGRVGRVALWTVHFSKMIRMPVLVELDVLIDLKASGEYPTGRIHAISAESPTSAPVMVDAALQKMPIGKGGPFVGS